MQQTEYINQKRFSHPFKAASVSDLTMWQHQFSLLHDQYCNGLLQHLYLGMAHRGLFFHTSEAQLHHTMTQLRDQETRLFYELYVKHKEPGTFLTLERSGPSPPEFCNLL